MGEDGLAFQSVQGQGQGPGQVSQDMINEIVQMLLSGVSPEELIQQGVPVEVVEEAMMIALAQAEGVGQPQMPVSAPIGNQGLAASFNQ